MTRVIVTRPERDAKGWVHDLSVRGLKAVALPLIQVGPVADPSEIVKAWQGMAGYVGFMFVSGNAVDYFFASKPAPVQYLNALSAIKTRAWATGPGTARALLLAGVPPERIDAPTLDSAQYDSENLWRTVGKQVRAGDRVLIIRGGDSAVSGAAGPGVGRDWFAKRLASVGAVADFVKAYQRLTPQFTSCDEALARAAATDGSVWLFSSSEAVANLVAWLPGQSWGAARALTTHARIGTAALEAGFGVVEQTRPTLSDVALALQRLGQDTL